MYGTQSDQIGCSSFVAVSPQGTRVVGKNLDWRKGPVLLLRAIPEDGYHSLSLVDLSLCDLFGLHEMKYALLTAPYVPFDGMNDQGLTVSMLSLQGASVYPSPPEKPMVGDFNMIRIMSHRIERWKGPCAEAGTPYLRDKFFTDARTGP
jgi:choloylglycine hydrolase